MVESFFATLKTELLMRGRLYHTRQEARTEIFAYLEGFYNRARRHSTLGYLSPVEFEQRAAHSSQRCPLKPGKSILAGLGLNEPEWAGVGGDNAFLNRLSYDSIRIGAPMFQDVMFHDSTPRHVSVLEIVLT